jgi:Ca-activated chloride channel family protein
MRGARRLVWILVLWILCTAVSGLPVPASGAANTSGLTGLSIYGSIMDNYANVTYELVFDNSESDSSLQVSWSFALQDGIRLSNISVTQPDEILWGRAMEEQEAVDLYNESVAQNMTAALVLRQGDKYTVSFNLRRHAVGTLGVYVEGLLTRHLGLYTCHLPILTSTTGPIEFSLYLAVRSSYGMVDGYAVRGIQDFSATDLSDGVRLTCEDSSFYAPEELVIVYALSRQTGGSQMLTHNNGTDSFFCYLLAPSITETSETGRRHYVFVFDRSGSMYGAKIDQAKTAFNSIVSDMRQDDLFNVISFSTEVSKLWVESHSGSSSNIAEAQAWINALTAEGSTNLYGASLTGLGVFSAGTEVKAMMLLSDGLPTSGPVTSASGILSAISETNTLGVSISTIAFGADADSTLMANIATQNDGYFAFVENDEEAASNIVEFYRSWCVPVASNYSIRIWGASDISTASPLRDSPFFNGTEVVVSGRYAASVSIETVIAYATGTEIYNNWAQVSQDHQPHVEYIWAQERISYLVKEASLQDASGALREEIIGIALRYGLIVPGYTAIILTSIGDQKTAEYDLDPYTTTPGWNPTATYTITGTTGTADISAFASLYILAPLVAVGLTAVMLVLLVRRAKR